MPHKFYMYSSVRIATDLQLIDAAHLVQSFLNVRGDHNLLVYSPLIGLKISAFHSALCTFVSNSAWIIPVVQEVVRPHNRDGLIMDRCTSYSRAHAQAIARYTERISMQMQPRCTQRKQTGEFQKARAAQVAKMR